MSNAPGMPTATGGIATAPEEPPPRPRASIAQLVLATLAVCFTLWATQEIVLPILLALFFALIGNPIIRLLQKLWLPRPLAAILVLLGGLALAFALGRQLVQPAAAWFSEVPQQMRKLAPKLQTLAKPVQDANKVAENIARAAGGENVNKAPPQVVKTEINDPYRALTATPKFLTQVLAVILLTLFFMIFGQNLQKHALDLLPSRQQKRITVDILQSIEREMSRYVLTISVINFAVGLVLALLLRFVTGMAMPEALLWGTIAALLNYAPYVGPLIGVLLFLLMGFITHAEIGPALLPAALYLGLHTVEGQIITPIVLGKRMAISPLILVIGLMVFGWGWGIIGLLLAVPLLVCVKIVLARIEGWEGWARLLE
ncbi:AI-2E family transporter [Luteimonas sp. e5]